MYFVISPVQLTFEAVHMRNSFLLFIFALCSCSCKVVLMGALPAPNPKPYVQLKEGNVYISDSVTRKGGKIITADSSFNSKEVHFYCNGKQTYSNVGYGLFAVKIFEGNWNVYRYSSVKGNDPYKPSFFNSMAM